MIDPLRCEHVLDLTNAPLGPGWLRRRDSWSDPKEMPAPGVWRTGPEGCFRAAMIEALDNAADVAQVCAFLFADEDLAEAMIRAAERGVRVYALTASEQRIGKLLPDDEEFGHRMAQAHKALLDRLAGKVLVRSAEHFHAKFLVVDPQDPANAKAFLSTANFNKALRDNVELGVLLRGTDAQDLAACFNWAFWCEADRELSEKGRLLPVDRPPGQPALLQGERVMATLKSSQALRETVLRMIRHARREILLATYGMDLDHEVMRALIDAAENGVAVSVLTRPRPAISAAVNALAAAGANVYGHDKLHAKALVADGAALVLSANFESSGLDHGFEIGALLSHGLATGIDATLREWIRDFPWVFRVDATRGEHMGDFLPNGKGLRDGVISVVSRHDQTCPDQVAPDALRLTEAPRPKLDPAPRQRQVPQRVAFSWAVVPPKLPKGAKERLQPKNPESRDRSYDPAIFDYAGKAYILLKNTANSAAAQTVAEDLGAIVVVP